MKTMKRIGHHTAFCILGLHAYDLHSAIVWNVAEVELLLLPHCVQYCTQQLQRWTHSAIQPLRVMLHCVSSPLAYFLDNCSWVIYSNDLNFKCCFPLAEERNKRKTYFSHELGAGSQYAGGNGHEVWKVFQFFLLPATSPDQYEGVSLSAKSSELPSVLGWGH